MAHVVSINIYRECARKLRLMHMLLWLSSLHIFSKKIFSRTLPKIAESVYTVYTQNICAYNVLHGSLCLWSAPGAPGRYAKLDGPRQHTRRTASQCFRTSSPGKIAHSGASSCQPDNQKTKKNFDGASSHFLGFSRRGVSASVPVWSLCPKTILELFTHTQQLPRGRKSSRLANKHTHTHT